MSSDFDFENSSSNYAKKIDFKDLFLNTKEGTSIIRIVDLKKGKSFKTHYVKDIHGNHVFVKSPGAGDPLTVKGAIPRSRYYLKVIDRATNKIKVWEFGSQIKQQIEEFVADLKEKRAKGLTDEEDVLTNYNIEIRKRRPGSNPLYTLSVRDRITNQDTLNNDAELIAADDIDLEPLLKPWSVERIKQQILGIGADEPIPQAAPQVPAAAPQRPQTASASSAPRAAASAPQPAPASAAKPAPAQVMAKASQSSNAWLEED
jgi:hypothetical protein